MGWGQKWKRFSSFQIPPAFPEVTSLLILLEHLTRWGEKKIDEGMCSAWPWEFVHERVKESASQSRRSCRRACGRRIGGDSTARGGSRVLAQCVSPSAAIFLRFLSCIFFHISRCSNPRRSWFGHRRAVQLAQRRSAAVGGGGVSSLLQPSADY